MINPQLQKKIDQSCRLLDQAYKMYSDIELAYSGGKDSDVILELAKMAGIPFTAIYKNTTIDPPGTIKHCLVNGVQIMQPKRTFFKLIEAKGYPSRFARFCCSELKEYKIKDTCILGIRREESIKRAKLYKEPEMCRVYKNGENVHQIMPILDWTQDDVKCFIESRGIRLHTLYYNSDGDLDCSRRLGCIGCPLQSDRGVKEFKEHPLFVRAWIKAGKKWWDAPRKKTLKSKQYFSDIYECFTFRTFYDTMGYRTLNKESLFYTDYKKILEDYFNVKL